MSTLTRRLYHVEGRLLHAGNSEDAATVKEAYEALNRMAEQRYSPIGDNHHNALLCPHCNPDGKEFK
jgi:hypothetical protein